jgi:UDP-2-acetamido-3-amino-2,3-dideoxy-glucuronate N-acetyltransferase
VIAGNELKLIHSTAVIDEGAVIGVNTRVWHFSHIMKGAMIGSGCNLGQNIVIESGAVLGNNVRVQNNVSIHTGVVCEDEVFIGPSVVFTNVINPRSAIPRKNQFKNTVIKKGASIGANATIVCGNTIGQFAFIGAGAVVTKSFPDFALAYGNPARMKGWVSEYGHKLAFDESKIAVCTESGQSYELRDDRVFRIQ